MRMRRKLIVVALVGAMAFGLSGCFLWPTASGAIDRLERFALTLDGVTGVETLRDTPENMAFPFGGNALGTAGVVMEGDDWQRDLPVVAEAVRDWLVTEQTDERVRLDIAVLVPFGALGIARNADETAGRSQLLVDLAEDAALTSATVGYAGEGAVDAETASVELGRAEATSLREVAEAWLPRIDGDVTIDLIDDVAAEPAPLAPVGERRDGTLDGARTFSAAAGASVDDALLQWAFAVDESPLAAGWRVTEPTRGSAQATVASASLDDVEAVEGFVTGLPMDGFTALTVVAPGLTLVTQDGPPNAAHTLGLHLARDGGFGSVHVATSKVDAGPLDPAATRDLLALAASTATADDPVALGFTTSLDGGVDLQVDGSDAAMLAGLVPALLDLDTTGMESLRLLSHPTISVSYEEGYDGDLLGAFFAGVRDAAIEAGVEVSVVMGESKTLFLLSFEATDQLRDADVWTGNRTEADNRHADAIARWNALG